MELKTIENLRHSKKKNVQHRSTLTSKNFNIIITLRNQRGTTIWEIDQISHGNMKESIHRRKNCFNLIFKLFNKQDSL